jgi:hypothetical protein
VIEGHREWACFCVSVRELEFGCLVNFTTITAVRPWRSDPKDCCWLQLVKMTEWASATEASQVVPTENPVYPGEELLLSGQAIILGVRTMKRARISRPSTSTQLER